MAEDYTANDLERQVLDPLFYRYEKALRLAFRLETEKKSLMLENHRLTEMARQSVQKNARLAQLESILETKAARERSAEPKLKALYDAAQALVIEVAGHPHKSPAQRKRGIAAATTFLRNAIAEAFEYCSQVPF